MEQVTDVVQGHMTAGEHFGCLRGRIHLDQRNPLLRQSAEENVGVARFFINDEVGRQSLETGKGAGLFGEAGQLQARRVGMTGFGSKRGFNRQHKNGIAAQDYSTAGDMIFHTPYFKIKL